MRPDPAAIAAATIALLVLAAPAAAAKPDVDPVLLGPRVTSHP